MTYDDVILILLMLCTISSLLTLSIVIGMSFRLDGMDQQITHFLMRYAKKDERDILDK